MHEGLGGGVELQGCGLRWLIVLFKERHHHNSTGKEEPFLQMMLESLDNCAAKKIPPVLL